MMKNSEWGAVAYLSHSKYGIGEEIQANNVLTTGNGNGITYGSGVSSYPQSTTGNITGIFDMSGSAFEYVMGNHSNTMSNSGFDSTWFDEISNQKYYDLYPSNVFTGTNLTNVTFCTIETCGGHALFETASWYSDFAYFVVSGSPWFLRGARYDDVDGFRYVGLDGAAGTDAGFRTVLVP